MAINKEVAKSIDLFERCKSMSEEHFSKMREWDQFRHGEQWSKKDEDSLLSIGHNPVVYNYIGPSVDQGIGFLTFRRPRFAVSPREDSDVKIARTWSNFLAYIWYISDGNTAFRTLVDDYYVKGMGYAYVYEDPYADFGKGELKFKPLEPWNVFVDPESSSKFFDDAGYIIYSKVITEDAFKAAYPDKMEILKKAEETGENLTPDTTLSQGMQSSGDLNLSGTAAYTQDWEDSAVSRFLLLERYTKESVPHYRVFNPTNGSESVYDKDAYEEYLAEPALVLMIDGKAQTAIPPETVNELVATLEQNNVNFAIAEGTNEQLVQEGLVKVAKYSEIRIKKVCSIGDQLLYEEILPISNYPIIPFPNRHTGTPFCESDVSRAISPQMYVNKMASLMMAYTQAAAGLRVFVPKGSVTDLSEIEENLLRPNSVTEYDASMGAPHFPQVPPLPNEIPHSIQNAKHMIEYSFGIFEGMMGNAQMAPETYRGTIAVDEMGQRKMRSKMQDIENSLTRVAQVLIEWSQNYYTAEKEFRVLQPNGLSESGQINKRVLADDLSGEIERMNDITVGSYDVIAVSGSSLPTNRYAEYETYKEAYQIGLVDREEVLKKSEIFDSESVLERTSEIGQLQSQIKGLEDQVKNLTGDLQTATRESTHDRKRVEIEKFKTKLDEILNELEAKKEVEKAKIVGELKNALIKFQSNLDIDENDYKHDLDNKMQQLDNLAANTPTGGEGAEGLN